MKNLLKVLLLSLVIVNSVACGRRTPRYSGNSRHGNRSRITQVDPRGSNNREPVNTVAPRIVNNVKPNAEQIMNDLVGHQLSEGVQDGYYPTNWNWTIKEREISNFIIEQVIKDTSSEYEVIANMRITSSAGKAFDAKVRICYVFNDTEGWRIHFVQSQGMRIVKTGNYDDCINAYVNRGALSWSFCLENNCEIALEVGGKILESGKWKCFSKVVAPHSTAIVGQVVDDGRIDYVEVP